MFSQVYLSSLNIIFISCPTSTCEFIFFYNRFLLKIYSQKYLFILGFYPTAFHIAMQPLFLPLLSQLCKAVPQIVSGSHLVQAVTIRWKKFQSGRDVPKMSQWCYIMVRPSVTFLTSPYDLEYKLSDIYNTILFVLLLYNSGFIII